MTKGNGMGIRKKGKKGQTTTTRSPWTLKEDAVLSEGVAKYGHLDMRRISTMLDRRSAKDCKERWEEHLLKKIQRSSAEAEEAEASRL